MLNRIVFAAAIVAMSSFAAEAATYYVKPGGTGDGAGSWANATASLSGAINAASAGDEVWVAAGTYNGLITLKTGVKVYGGFAGTETAASQSNPATNVTTINGNGSRAVRGEDNDVETVLRGFTISGGAVQSYQYGGGLELENSSALIVRCTFTGNTAEYFAGAVVTWGGSPKFINCRFSGNSAGYGCGAVMSREFGTPTFVNCLFHDNTALEGGAVCNLSGASTFANCTFSQNRATEGKGGALVDNKGEAKLRNCILWANEGVEAATKEIYSNAASTTTVTYCDVEGGWTGDGNINADPLFANPAVDDYHLCGTTMAPSPCKNTGNNAHVQGDAGDLDWDGNKSEQIPFDLHGLSRIIGSNVDIGAYERGTGSCESQ